jgi:hypothetical protein
MRLAILSLSIFASVVAAILIFTDYNAAYFNDILGVVSQTSAVRHGLGGMAIIIAKHLGIFLLCFAALTAVYLAGRRNYFDFAFVIGCIIASVMILNQSGGTERGLPALLAVFLICSELARRTECRIEEGAAASSWPGNIASISILYMLLAFVSEPMLQGGAALQHHFKKTTDEQSVATMNLSGIFVGAGPTVDVHETLGHDDAAHALVNQLLGSRESTFGALTASEYLPLIAEGVKLLESVPHDNHSVITFEHTNPFSALLGMRPTEYGYPLFWAEFMLSRNLPAPERYFSDADYVMVPEIPYKSRQLEKLMEVYGLYLEENFYELKRSSHWRLYAR